MGPISVTADAALDIIRKLATGELEIHGILLRDANGKRFRHILRGFENLPTDPARIADLPLLGPLRAAMNVQQLMQVVAIAQNAAMAATLRRIEHRLDEIERRLTGINQRLSSIDAGMNLIRAGMLNSPANRLKAAKNAAVTALRHNNIGAMIGASENAESAARDILDQACDLVKIEQDGLPMAVLAPDLHADLVESAAEALSATSAIFLALKREDAAASLLREGERAMQNMVRRLHKVYADPELALRRMKTDGRQDLLREEAGRRTINAIHGLRGRAFMIEQGLIGPDPERLEFETATPCSELSFVPIGDEEITRATNSRG